MLSSVGVERIEKESIQSDEENVRENLVLCPSVSRKYGVKSVVYSIGNAATVSIAICIDTIARYVRLMDLCLIYFTCAPPSEVDRMLN